MAKRIVPALALLALLALPAPLAAQDGLDRVGRRLDEIASVSAMQGYRLDGQAMSTYAVSGTLKASDTVKLVLNLWAGRSYRITGVCDRNCGNFDLSLHDAASDGGAVAEDSLEDSVPLLEFTAATTGPHLLSVTMHECRGEGCFFGVRVLSKP